MKKEWPIYFSLIIFLTTLVACSNNLNHNKNTSMIPSKIMNGELSSREDFPAVVGVVIRAHNQNEIGLCSGTLIAPDIVLTAAHCFDTEENIDVYIRLEKDLRNKNNYPDIKVTKIEINPESEMGAYYTPSSLNDNALLYLSAPLIKKEQLPRIASKEELESLIGKVITVYDSGYGLDENNENGRLKIIKNTVRLLKNHNALRVVSTISGTNVGDSGGPLWIKTNNEWVILGVHSTIITQGLIDSVFDSYSAPAYTALTIHDIFLYHQKITSMIKNNPEEGKKELINYLKDHPKDYKLRLLYAQILYNEQKFSEAENVIIENWRLYAPSLLLQAKIEWEMNPQNNRLGHILKQALILDPNFQEVKDFAADKNIELPAKVTVSIETPLLPELPPF